jgi:hypothetical protein
MRIATARPGPGPSRSGLLVLAVASLALLATSQSIGTLESKAAGEVGLSGGETVEQAVRVHLTPDAVQDASRGTIRAGFRSGNGLDVGYSGDATVMLVPAAGAATATQAGELPLSDCPTGCDLAYTARFEAAQDVLPGSTARYEVVVEIQYGGSFGDRPSSYVTIELEQPATGPAPATWAVIAGVLGLLAGWFAGPRVDAALGPGRRWPAVALAVVPVAALVLELVQRLALMSDIGVGLAEVGLFFFDPWTTALLVILAGGVIRGIRRWDADGGWSLGLGALALAGLGGLWLVWRATLEPVGQPVVAAVVAAALGLIAGTVVGQGWRVDARAAHDRLPAGAAIVSNGILIAGFAFLANNSLFDPFSTTPVALSLLIPAGLVALALWLWFGSSRVLLILFDLLIVLAGLLGLWVFVIGGGYPFTLGPEAIGSVAVAIAFGAAVVGLVSAFHRMPGRDRGPSPAPAGPEISAEPTPVASPPTT